MRAEILHIQDCPGWAAVGSDLRAALHATGHRDVPVTFTLLASGAEAKRVPFAGSPTILIDGVDLFPSAERTENLACRLYVTPAGLSGRPTREQLEAALVAYA